MKKLVKADFDIRGHFTGTRIVGNAGYIYEVFFKVDIGCPINGGVGWTAKSRASAWLGKVVRAYNDGTLADKDPKLAKLLADKFADKS